MSFELNDVESANEWMNETIVFIDVDYPGSLPFKVLVDCIKLYCAVLYFLSDPWKADTSDV